VHGGARKKVGEGKGYGEEVGESGLESLVSGGEELASKGRESRKVKKAY